MTEKKISKKSILTTSLTSEEGNEITFKDKSITKKISKEATLMKITSVQFAKSEIEGKAKILDRLHKFCLDCFTAWQKANKNTTCPNCRKIPKIYFTTSEGGAISSFKVSNIENEIIATSIKCNYEIKKNGSIQCIICNESYHKNDCISGYNSSRHKNLNFICHECYRKISII